MITNRHLLKIIFSQKSFVCVEIIFFRLKNVKFAPPKKKRERENIGHRIAILHPSIHHGMLVDVKSELNTLGVQLFQKLKEPAVLIKNQQGTMGCFWAIVFIINF
jgi:hypothetical protein